jgi:hypothetical protein
MEQAQKESLPFIPESFPLSFFLIITKKKNSTREGKEQIICVLCKYNLRDSINKTLNDPFNQ